MTDYAVKTILVDGVTKYTVNFALTDESGAPLLDRAGNARVTNLVADSMEELIPKMAIANVEASRAADKANKFADTLKNRKPTPRAAAPDMKGKPLTQEEQLQVGLDVQDPRKAAPAIEKMIESRIGPVAGEVERQAKNIDLATKQRIAVEFFARHKNDLANVSANGAMIAKWIIDNSYEFTLDNMEVAFATLGDALARPKPVVPANDPPPDAARNEPPRNDPPNSGTPPPQPRRAPVGGISNSQASAQPGAGVPVLSKAQAEHMLKHNMPEFEAWMRDPVKNKILNAALGGR